MRTMLILLLIALFTFYISIVHAEESDTHAIDANEVIEELVVIGVGRCGTWPIAHQSLKGCEFAELEMDDLPKVLDLRPKLFSDCLICQGNQCTTKAWPEDQITEQLLCKRLFWTPTRVSKPIKPLGRYSPLRASYTFNISTDGRVKGIELISFDGDIGQEELMQLIADGAARTRFEPIVVAEVAYELVGLRDTIIRP